MTKVNIPTASLPLTPTPIKTTSYTAAPGDFVLVDTTSGAVTITLPTSPPDKTRIGVKLITQGSTNTVTIARGGSDVFNKTGGATSLTLSLLNQGLIVQYQATGTIWLVQGDDVPLSGLDTRYASLVSPALTGTPTAPTMSPNVDSGYDALLASLNPVAWWKLTDAAGSSQVADASGNGYTGTVIGGVTFGQTGPITGAPAETAALFDGSTGYITIPNFSLNSAYTVLLWARLSSTGFLLGNNGASSNIIFRGNASPYGIYFYGGGNPQLITATEDNNYHLIAATVSSTQVGYLDGTQAFTGSASVPALSEMIIGARTASGGAGSWSSDIAQVAVFNYVLTQAQINSLYTARTSGVPIATTAYADSAAKAIITNPSFLTTLDNRYPNVFDPRAYGAKWDGVTDDTVAINACSLALYNAGGGTMFCPVGTARASGTLYYYPSTSWLGAAQGASVT